MQKVDETSHYHLDQFQGHIHCNILAMHAYMNMYVNVLVKPHQECLLLHKFEHEAKANC